MRTRTCVKPACMGKFFFCITRDSSLFICYVFCLSFVFFFCSFYISGARAYTYIEKNKLQQMRVTIPMDSPSDSRGLRYSYARWILVLTINPL